MDPQQELFSAVLMALKEKYEDTGITEMYPYTYKWAE